VREHKFENLIALCPNCHTRYDSGEIDRKAMLMYKARLGVMNERLHSSWLDQMVTIDVELDADEAANVAELMSQLKTGNLGLWDPSVRQSFLPRVLTLSDIQRRTLVLGVSKILSVRPTSEEVRWDAAFILEFLVKWDPSKVPAELLLVMSKDPFFSVRSSAAVSYYYLAGCSPAAVPVQVLGRLASVHEDWYVMTPATSALLRLARTRDAAVEVLATGISHRDDDDSRDHAASALERLANVSPAALREDIANMMTASGHARLIEVGKTWKQVIRKRRALGQGLDYYIF
jgi:hypothetical protein